MPSVIFLTGFEHGLVTASNTVPATTNRVWDAISGSPAIETTTVRNGSKALRIETSAAAEYVSLSFMASIRYLVGSVYFRIVSMPTGGDFRLLSASTTAGGQIFVINTSGQLIAEPGGNSGDRQTGPTLSTGQWYRLDFYFNTSSTNHTIDWKVNGTAYTQAVTSDSPGFQDMTNFRFGTTLAATGTVLYDDAVLSSSFSDFPLGEYKVLGYFPNDDGTHGSTYASKFRDGAGVDISGSNEAWDNLTDLTETTAKVEQYARTAGEDATTYVEIAMADSSESNAPVSVSAVSAIISAGTQANNISLRLYSGSNYTSLFSGDPSVTGVAQAFQNFPIPPGGGSWTDALFDALTFRFGYSSDVAPVPGLSGVMLEAAFAVSGTQTPQSVSGASTSAGTLALQTKKYPFGASTSAGALNKQISKTLSGVSTSIGELIRQTWKYLTGESNSSGLLSQFKATLITLTGVSDSAGTLNKQISKALSGASTSAGELIRQTLKTLTGESNSSGTLQALRAYFRLLTGESNSSGTLSKQTSKTLDGASTSAGALIRQISKLLTGESNSSGILESLRAYLRLLTGESNSSGTLSKQTSKTLGGTSTSAGALNKQISKLFTGASTSAGALARQVSKALSGASTSAGTLGKRVYKTFAGVSTSSGAIIRQIRKIFSGLSTSLGELLAQLNPLGGTPTEEYIYGIDEVSLLYGVRASVDEYDLGDIAQEYRVL